MFSSALKIAAAAGILAASAAGVGSSAQAAPMPTSVGKLGTMANSNVSTVQYRRAVGGGWRGGWRGGYGYRGYGWRGYGYRGYGWGWGWPYYGAAFATGLAIGAAPYYYGGYPAYGYPVYEAAPAPAPRSGGVRQCWIDTDSSRGYGYWRPC
jgi:hypothetical protein